MSQGALSPVLDYLMAQLPAVVQAVDPNGMVYEGLVSSSSPPDTVLVVGREEPENPQSADAARDYIELGTGRVNETINLFCYVDCFQGGVEDQSITRRRAALIFDGVVDLIRADLTLGGALKNGRWAELEAIRLLPSRPEDVPAGRRTVLSFTVVAHNFY